MVMLCSDDKHPNDLVRGHINELVLRAVANGHSLMDVLQCACVNPVQHYDLEVGLLQEGQPADFIVVNNLSELKVEETYINGIRVAEKGKTKLPYLPAESPNKFNSQPKQPADFTVKATTNHLKVIEALEGQPLANALTYEVLTDQNGNAISNTGNDVLKLAVVNRYQNTAHLPSHSSKISG